MIALPRSASSRHYDAIIIGARCAGAATARLLARQGRRVLVVDRSRYGTDTLSTHALMRCGVLQLHRWGLLPRLRAAGTPTVKTTAFHYADDVTEIRIKPQAGLDGLYAPRRTVLDAMLSDAAAEAGAEIRRGVRVVELIHRPDGRVAGAVLEDRRLGRVRVAADMVIGADGARSGVARMVAAPVRREGQHASGVIYGYWAGLDVRGYHWYYRPGLSVGAIPTNDGLTCVFVSLPAARLLAEHHGDLDTRYHQLLATAAPELAASVARADRQGSLHGFPGLRGFMRQAWGPGWALVGDAGYFKDPITAHGMSDALRDAELLARAIDAAEGRGLQAYQATRDELSSALFDLTDRIASYAWDLETVKQWHLDLSEEMGREVAWINELDARIAAADRPVAVA